MDEIFNWGGGNLPFLDLRRKGLAKSFIYQNIFPSPLYINNDRSLTTGINLLCRSVGGHEKLLANNQGVPIFA